MFWNIQYFFFYCLTWRTNLPMTFYGTVWFLKNRAYLDSSWSTDWCSTGLDEVHSSSGQLSSDTAHWLLLKVQILGRFRRRFAAGIPQNAPWCTNAQKDQQTFNKQNKQISLAEFMTFRHSGVRPFSRQVSSKDAFRQNLAHVFQPQPSAKQTSKRLFARCFPSCYQATLETKWAKGVPQ